MKPHCTKTIYEEDVYCRAKGQLMLMKSNLSSKYYVYSK